MGMFTFPWEKLLFPFQCKQYIFMLFNFANFFHIIFPFLTTQRFHRSRMNGIVMHRWRTYKKTLMFMYQTAKSTSSRTDSYSHSFTHSYSSILMDWEYLYCLFSLFKNKDKKNACLYCWDILWQSSHNTTIKNITWLWSNSYKLRRKKKFKLITKWSRYQYGVEFCDVTIQWINFKTTKNRNHWRRNSKIKYLVHCLVRMVLQLCICKQMKLNLFKLLLN